MADVKAARAEIQKVVSLLVNRFGPEADVFEHLTLALAHLREDPPAKPVVEPEPVAEPEPEADPEPDETPEPAPEPEVKPKARKRTK